jgi:phenylacetate-coenzyme A ligase PaaK-like adenylate-forming protein
MTSLKNIYPMSIKRVLRKSVAKNIGYPVQDLIKRTFILKSKQFLMDTQYWSINQLQEYQFNKLKKLLDFSYENVPYYEKLFNKLGLLPKHIKTFEDFKKIPVLTKKIAIENNDDLKARITFKHLKRGVTGGTTGPPLKVQSSIEARSMVWGAYYRWYDWIGIEIGDPLVELWGASRVTNLSYKIIVKENIVNYLKNILRFNSFNMNEETMPVFIKNIRRHQPKMVKGYLSALLQLAEYIEGNNVKDIIPKALSTTSETLLPSFRLYLEEVFNSKIYDQYGCGECQSIAFECGQQKGMHITLEHVFFEVLNDKNEDAGFNNGRIIVTDLDNYAMPFIRYENGDSCCLSEALCTCGLKHPLIKNVSGRTTDNIVLKNGSKVHGVFFTDILTEIKPELARRISRFQAYQERSGELEFRLETKNNLPQDYLEQIEKALNNHFYKVEIKLLPKIPNSKSGKFRYVLSNLKNL